MELPQGENPFTKISSLELYRRPYVRFMKDLVKINGLEKDYSYADIANGIGIVAINDRNEVALVGQWRYPIDRYSWEIPAGMREGNEDPLLGAQRELKEEAGVTARKWTPLGEFFMEGSSTTKKAIAFLAQDLKMGEQSLDDDEKIEVLWMPFQQLLELIEQGKMQDGFSVLALLRARMILDKG